MVKQDNKLITSSNKITLYLRVAKNQTRWQTVHEAYANLKDDDNAVQYFERVWGPIAERPMMARFGFAEILRRAWRGDETALAEIIKWMNVYLVTSIRYIDGRIEVEPRDLLATIFMLFLRDHSAGKTAICGNPECIQPYLIKQRATQKFCLAPECKHGAQKQYALKWWNEIGKKRREKNQKKSKQGEQ